jgi:hypothetical protein
MERLSDYLIYLYFRRTVLALHFRNLLNQNYAFAPIQLVANLVQTASSGFYRHLKRPSADSSDGSFSTSTDVDERNFRNSVPIRRALHL